MGCVSKDVQILLKIKKNMKLVNEIFIDIKDEKDLDDNRDGLALMQCLTNLHELACRLEDDDLKRDMFDLITNPVSTMRNIAAHDYDSLNWFKVKKCVQKLVKKYTGDFFEECINHAKSQDDSTDYLDLFKKDKDCTRNDDTE